MEAEPSLKFIVAAVRDFHGGLRRVRLALSELPHHAEPLNDGFRPSSGRNLNKAQAPRSDAHHINLLGITSRR